MKRNNTPRAPLERMRYLAELLRAGRPFTASSAAERWEVSSKTIRRDLTFMRDRLRYDFDWNARANAYLLTKAPEPQL